MAAGRLLLDTTGNSQRKPFFTSLIPPPLVVCAPFVVFDVDSTLFPWCNFFYCFLFAGLRVVAVLFCFRCQGARLFCRFSFYCSESRSTRRREQARGAQITGQPTHVLPLVPRPFHKDVDRLSKVPRVRLTLLFFITLASLSLSLTGPPSSFHLYISYCVSSACYFYFRPAMFVTPSLTLCIRLFRVVLSRVCPHFPSYFPL